MDEDRGQLFGLGKPCVFEVREREGGHPHVVCRYCGFRALGESYKRHIRRHKKEKKAAANAVKKAAAAAKREGAAAGRKEAVRALAHLLDLPQKR